MARIVSIELINSLLAGYEAACLAYYRNRCDETLKTVKEMERDCLNAKVHRSELTRIRIAVKNALEVR